MNWLLHLLSPHLCRRTSPIHCNHPLLKLVNLRNFQQLRQHLQDKMMHHEIQSVKIPEGCSRRNQLDEERHKFRLNRFRKRCYHLRRNWFYSLILRKRSEKTSILQSSLPRVKESLPSSVKHRWLSQNLWSITSQISASTTSWHL